MVVFTCNHCGDSLQKPRVEKHYYTQCRRFKSLTCVDCFKDFKGEEYTTHTKCITEEERYSAKGTFVAGVKKGEVKQESWMEMIKSIVDSEVNLKPSVKNLLETLSNNSNVPRKKAKFMNFMKSCLGARHNRADVEAVWDIIEKYQNEAKLKTEQNEKKRKATGVNEEDSKVAKIPKIEMNGTDGESVEKFSFKQTIISILNNKKVVTPKKLQKRVMNAYAKETGNEVTEKTIKKYNKKLRKLPNVVVAENSISLMENPEP